MCTALMDAGIDFATCDPRSANPPCVLFAPPSLRYDTMGSPTGEWRLFALAPSNGNADAWVLLEDMAAIISATLDVERADYVAYSLSPDMPNIPAYRFTFTQGIEL